VAFSRRSKHRVEIGVQAWARCFPWRRTVDGIICQLVSLGFADSGILDQLAVIRVLDHVPLPTWWDDIPARSRGARTGRRSRRGPIIIVYIEIVLSLWSSLRQQESRRIRELWAGAAARRLFAAGQAEWRRSLRTL
jgi:hypothetical protein